MSACLRTRGDEIIQWGGANETNYFHLITHEAGLLIFPWRFSLSGCLQITTDEFLITLESEVLEQC